MNGSLFYFFLILNRIVSVVHDLLSVSRPWETPSSSKNTWVNWIYTMKSYVLSIGYSSFKSMRYGLYALIGHTQTGIYFWLPRSNRIEGKRTGQIISPKRNQCVRICAGICAGVRSSPSCFRRVFFFGWNFPLFCEKKGFGKQKNRVSGLGIETPALGKGLIE